MRRRAEPPIWADGLWLENPTEEGAMSWPYSPNECPSCVFLQLLDDPAYDDAGYEIVGICQHPKIATDLFLFMKRDQTAMDPCPCFKRKRRAGRPTVTKP